METIAYYGLCVLIGAAFYGWAIWNENNGRDLVNVWETLQVG